MKTVYLKLALPLTLATLLANADQLDFTKNLPLDSKTVAAFNEYSLPTYDIYDHRLSMGTNFLGRHAGVTYARVKPNSTFIEVSSFANTYDFGITTMGGYNFLLSPQDILTPAVGLLYYSANSKTLYPLVALGYEHAFNNVFSLGAEVGRIIYRDFNVSLGIPLTFHFGDQKRWDVRLTPVLSHVESHGSMNIMTINCNLGYRF